MNPVDRLLFVATDWLYMHETASKLLEMSRLDKLASLPYRTLKKQRLIRRYGPSFERDFTGELTVNGATFRLQDPWLHYLPMAMAGFDYEPAVTRHLKQVIGNRRLCFLDVGAFMGYYTAYVGTLNRKCEIHSFEPNTDFYKILDNNVKLNRINAKLHKVALSDETGEIPFAGRSMNLEDGYEVETVASVPFDALRDEEHISPDVVKVDVHGAEGKVLYGMRTALKRDVEHLYCELHPAAMLIGYTVKDILDLLRKSGFELFEVNRFRRRKTPEFTALTAQRYQEMIDVHRWTNTQIKEMRMLYASKEPVLPMPVG